MSEATLVDSEVVGQWKQPLRPMFICPPPSDEPDPCDCGFDGEWERREVYVWHDKPGYRRGDKLARRDLAEGLPARVHDEGWWVMAGYDERCPSCGDIERFNNDAERVTVIVETIRENVVDWDAWRRVRNAAPAPTPGVEESPE